MVDLALLDKITKKNKFKMDFDFIDIKLIEEMGELTQALIKYDNDDNSLLEEVADTWIMLTQKMSTLDPDKLEKIIEYKLKRTGNFLGLCNEDIGESMRQYINREEL